MAGDLEYAQQLIERMEKMYNKIRWHRCPICSEEFSRAGWHCKCGNDNPQTTIFCSRCKGSLHPGQDEKAAICEATF